MVPFAETDGVGDAVSVVPAAGLVRVSELRSALSAQREREKQLGAPTLKPLTVQAVIGQSVAGCSSCQYSSQLEWQFRQATHGKYFVNDPDYHAGPMPLVRGFPRGRL